MEQQGGRLQKLVDEAPESERASVVARLLQECVLKQWPGSDAMSIVRNGPYVAWFVAREKRSDETRATGYFVVHVPAGKIDRLAREELVRAIERPNPPNVVVAALDARAIDLLTEVVQRSKAKGNVEYWGPTEIERFVIRPQESQVTVQQAQNPPQPRRKRVERAMKVERAIKKEPAGRRVRVASASLSMAGDSPVLDETKDKLEFKPYVDALASLIDNPKTATPLSIAVNAPWGAGKSSLGRMVESRLKGKPATDGYLPHCTVWFDAWMHDDAENLAGAFVSHVSQEASRMRPLWLRLLRPTPTALRSPSERTFWRIAKGALVFAGILGLAGLLVVQFPDLIGFLPGLDAEPKYVTAIRGRWGDVAAKITLGLAAAIGLWAVMMKAASAVASYVQKPAGESGAGSMRRVREQLHGLIRAATPPGSRFVVFVDDLERCKPPRSVDILETVNQLLDAPNVVVIVLADMETVSACVDLKYRDLANVLSGDEKAAHRPTFGRKYVQKILQVQFDLPVHRPQDLQAYVTKASKQEPATTRKATGHSLFAAAARPLSRTISGIIEAVRHRDFRSGLTAIIAIGVGAAVAYAFESTTIGDSPSPIPGIGIPLLATTFTIVILLYPVQRRVVRSLLDRARIRADSAVLEGAQPSGPGAPGFSEEEFKKILDERKALHYANDSPFVVKAIEEAVGHLPPLPRNAKRVLNRTRLLTVVAVGRKLLDPPRPLKASELGKWVALQERWPDLATAVARQTRLMGELETANDEQLRALTASFVPPDELDGLKKFVEDAPPLAPCVDALALFVPITS